MTPTHLPHLPLASTPTPRSSLPRGVWIGFASLGLVTAALAGALVMRPAAPPAPPDAAVSSAGTPMVEVPSVTSPRQPMTSHSTARSGGSAHAASPRTADKWNAPGGTTPATACSTCGVVESVKAVQLQGQGSGVGVVAGGVVGGLLGHQFGGGKGKTAMTVLGAVGGGVAGNEIEKRARSETVYDITVRMDDGSTRLFRRSEAFAVGSPVMLEGRTFRLAGDGAPRDNSGAIRAASPLAARNT